jgi:hypothetical protein
MMRSLIVIAPFISLICSPLLANPTGKREYPYCVKLEGYIASALKWTAKGRHLLLVSWYKGQYRSRPIIVDIDKHRPIREVNSKEIVVTKYVALSHDEQTLCCAFWNNAHHDVDRGLKEGHFCAMSWGHDELPADPQSAICSPRRRPVPFASIDGTPNSLAQFDRRSIQGLARAGPRLWPHAKALLTSQGPDCPVQAVVPYVASRRCRRVRPHRRTTPCSS